MLNRPNILHIMTDQQRFDTIGCLNNPIIKTPNIDKLIKSGVAFTNAYTPSPVCVAARCSMIYGQYPMKTGCYENTIMPMDGRKTFMQRLADEGCLTHGIGKCHFTPDSYDLKGFNSRERQEELGISDIDREPYFKHLKNNNYDYVCEAFGVRGEMYYTPQPSQLPEKLHPSTWIADRSISFIENASHDKPWYLYSSFIHPHPPFTPPNPWHKIYRGMMMPMPNVPDDSSALHTYVNKVQNRYKYRDNGLDKNMVRVMKAYYYACISFVDYQVGRILDELEKSGQMENTLILYTSDHGEHLGDYNCFGKRTFHDTAARIPMLISMKGRFEGGVVCDVPVSLVDVAPTLLSAANIPYSDNYFDGVDMHDILTGKSQRNMVFGQHSYNLGNPVNHVEKIPIEFKGDENRWRASCSTYMAVTKEWKYFYSAADDREFLFDRISDPKETRNKASVAFARDALKYMRSQTIHHLREGGEISGLTENGFYSFEKKTIPEDPDAGLLIQDDNIPWIRNIIDGYSSNIRIDNEF